MQYAGGRLFDHFAVEGLKNDRDQIVTLGALDLLEGLNVLVFGAVHDGQNFGHKVGLISGPVTT
jgi:hypothetical protein